VTDLDALLDIVEHARAAPAALDAAAAPNLEFSVGEYGRRCAVAAALMDATGIDALVLAQPQHVRYFAGLQTWLPILPPLLPTFAVLPRDPRRATLVSTALERGGIEATSWVPEPVLYGGADDPIDALAGAVRAAVPAGGTVGLELGLGQRPNLSPADHGRLLAALDGYRLVDAAMPLWAARAIKSGEEVERLREATRLSQVGYLAAFDGLRPGTTEAELTRIAARAMLEAGALPSPTPMTLIFLAGPERYRQIVQPAGHRPIREGELVWLDGGCSVDGYRADLIRSGVIGRLSDAAERHHEIAVEALDAAVRALAPGRPLGDSWSAAQAVFDAAGVGTATVTPDMVGHSIGLDHWELPLVSRPGTEHGEVRARPGMVLCIEPTIAGMDGDERWHGGLFVVEDQVLVTDTGVEVLTSDIPRSLIRR
jgi:Xaa-Pro dipeptidase